MRDKPGLNTQARRCLKEKKKSLHQAWQPRKSYGTVRRHRTPSLGLRGAHGSTSVPGPKESGGPGLAGGHRGRKSSLRRRRRGQEPAGGPRWWRCGGACVVGGGGEAVCVRLNVPANIPHLPQRFLPPRRSPEAPLGLAAAAAQPPRSPAPQSRSPGQLQQLKCHLLARGHAHTNTGLVNRHCKASPGSAPRPGSAAAPCLALPGAGGAEPGPAAPFHPGSGSPRTPRASKYLPVHGRFPAIAVETVIHWIRLLRLFPSRRELEVSQSCPGHFRIISIFRYFSPLSSDRGEGRGGWKSPSGIQPHPCRATSI